MSTIWKSLRLFVFLVIVTGVVYPLVITLISQAVFTKSANGNFIELEDKVIGAAVIGQNFESDIYFWGRPSHTDNHTLPSGASNFGPTSKELKKIVSLRMKKISEAHEVENNELIPRELLFSSGCGIDPDISPQTALFQIPRIIRARGYDSTAQKKLEIMIQELTEGPSLGFIGNPTVNVLKLNMELDNHFKRN